MSKRIIFCIGVCHFLLCILLAIVLQDGFLGYALTFLLLYLVSLSVLVAGIAVVSGVRALIKKNYLRHKLVCAGLGSLVLLCYLLSASGALAGSIFVGAAYALIPTGTMGILIIWLWHFVKSKKAR